MAFLKVSHTATWAATKPTGNSFSLHMQANAPAVATTLTVHRPRAPRGVHPVKKREERHQRRRRVSVDGHAELVALAVRHRDALGRAGARRAAVDPHLVRAHVWVGGAHEQKNNEKEVSKRRRKEEEVKKAAEKRRWRAQETRRKGKTCVGSFVIMFQTPIKKRAYPLSRECAARTSTSSSVWVHVNRPLSSAPAAKWSLSPTPAAAACC